MALESATYIDGLVPANPLGSDAIAFADDHIRLIKTTLKNTFPNLSGAVNWNQNQFNTLMPMGGIIMWSGASIPSGWALCNGQTVAKSDGSGNITTPNLIDRFIVGAGSTYPIATAGGSAFISLNSSQLPTHSHTAFATPAGDHYHNVNGNTSSVGDHTHGNQNLGSVQAGSDNGGANVAVNTGYSSGRFQANTLPAGGHFHTIDVNSANAGNHGHDITIGNAGSGSAIDIRNPYYALYYIMKV
jgi:microcystin-dependent protein